MPQRADARRNRQAILDAAGRLVEAQGADQVRISDVARLARVGAGSVYRAFGDKAGLLLALLDEDERSLQSRMISGDPPLGPDALPAERVRAFLHALHQLTFRRRHILIAADGSSSPAHLRSGAHQGWATHLRVLFDQLQPADDHTVLAEFVLACLSAPTYVHVTDDLGRNSADLAAEVDRLALMVCDSLRG